MRVAAISLCLAVVACGGGGATSDDASPVDAPAPDAGSVDAPPDGVDAGGSFAVGGEVRCMVGTGLVLRNGGETLAITGNGPFVFTTPTANGAPYDVLVESHPGSPPQSCVVRDGVGIASAPVTDIIVSCSGPATQWVPHAGQPPASVRITPLDADHCPGPSIDVTPPNVVGVESFVRRTPDGRFAVTPLYETTHEPPAASFVLDLASSSGPSAAGLQHSTVGVSISPTGAHVAITQLVAGERALYIAPLTSPFVATPVLVQPAVPRLIGVVWSPDGAMMAYVLSDLSSQPEPSEAYLVDLSTGPPYVSTRLDSTPEHWCTWMSFSPDSRRLACRYGNPDAAGVALFDVSQPLSPTMTVLAQPTEPGFTGGAPVFSPDGRLLVFSVATWFSNDLHYVDLSTDPPGAPQPLHPTLPAGHSVYDFRFSPDSRAIVLTGTLEVSDDPRVYAISVADATPGPVTRISNQPVAGDRIQWIDERMVFSPSGDRVYFLFETQSQARYLEVASLEPIATATIVPMPPDNAPGTILEHGGPEGRTLLLTTWRADHEGLLALDITGAHPPVHVEPAGMLQDHAVVPQLTFDGTGILFTAIDPANPLVTNLYVTDLSNGLGPQQVNEPVAPTGGEVSMATCTPAFQGGASAASMAASASATRGDGPSR